MSYDPGYIQPGLVGQPQTTQPPPPPQAPNVMQQIANLVDARVAEALDARMAQYQEALAGIVNTVQQVSNWSGDAHMRLERFETAFNDIYGALATLQENDKALRELIVDRLSGDIGAHYRHVQDRYKRFITAEAAGMKVSVGELSLLRKQMEKDEAEAEQQAARDAFGEQTARDMMATEPEPVFTEEMIRNSTTPLDQPPPPPNIPMADPTQIERGEHGGHGGPQ